MHAIISAHNAFPISIMTTYILGKCTALWGEPEQAIIVYVAPRPKRLAIIYRLSRIHTCALVQSSVLLDVIFVVVQAVRLLSHVDMHSSPSLASLSLLPTLQLIFNTDVHSCSLQRSDSTSSSVFRLLSHFSRC